MKNLMVGAVTLVAAVGGLVLFTTLDSSAQEGPDGEATTTTTLNEQRPLERFGFGFGFDGELPAEVEELLNCLAEQGIEVPDDPDRGFFFDLRSEDFEGLAEALGACEFPGRPFHDGPLFGGELPDGFPFEDLPDELRDRLPEGFPFGGHFPFGELPDDFEGMPFGGRFEFGKPGPSLDRDALAECLAELGSFDSVDSVRTKLDECLPEVTRFGFGRGPHWFDFELEDPEAASSSA